MSHGLDPIRTNLGCAGYGDNWVRGQSVRDALLGHDTRWSVLSRFLGSGPLDRDTARFLDDVLVATIAPDPRIWPLKIGWLVGAYGDFWAAGAAVQGMLAECRMGPWACAAACPTAQHFEREWRAGHDGFEDRVVSWARTRWRAHEPIWGFGVAGGNGRARDERLTSIDAAVRLHGRQDAPFYRASMLAAGVLAERLDRPANMALAVAAIGLDLGMDRAQIEALMFQVLEPQILGNAFEAARLQPASLRSLPPSTIDYRGRAPRSSNRSASR